MKESSSTNNQFLNNSNKNYYNQQYFPKIDDVICDDINISSREKNIRDYSTTTHQLCCHTTNSSITTRLITSRLIMMITVSLLVMNVVTCSEMILSSSSSLMHSSSSSSNNVLSSSQYIKRTNTNLQSMLLGLQDEHHELLEYVSSMFHTHSTIPNYNASLSTSCDPFLFNGGFSREETPTEIYGLCPDTIFTPIVSAVFYVIYLLLTLVTFIGLVWKWNSRHITERYPLSLVFSLIGNVIFESILSIRFIVGRSVFPCFLYGSIYFLFSASTFLPTIYKCFRLFFKFKLSKKKIELFSLQKEMGVEQEMYESMHSENKTKNIFASPNNPFAVPNKEIESKKRYIKIYSFLLSAKFLVPMLIFILFLHLALWIVVGVSDEFSEKKIFFVDGGTFLFDRGCSVEKNTSILVTCEAVVYIIILSIFVILSIRTDKDIWSIKKETLAVVVVQVIFCLIYIITSQIDIVVELVDYFVPFGTCMLFYCAIEQFVTIFLPVLYSVRYDSKKSEEISMEVAIKLKEGDAYEEILDVTRRSYHPEQMLAWYDIELFKNGKLPTTKETALQIIRLYLETESPLNINAPKHFDIPNLLSIANNSPFIPRDMFDGVQSFCFNDICKCLYGHNGTKFELNENKLDLGIWNDF